MIKGHIQVTDITDLQTFPISNANNSNTKGKNLLKNSIKIYQQLCKVMKMLKW